MLVFAVVNHVFAGDIDAVTRREEIVPRLFKTSLAYQHDACSQAYGQAQYLNEIVLAALVERF